VYSIHTLKVSSNRSCIECTPRGGRLRRLPYKYDRQLKLGSFSRNERRLKRRSETSPFHLLSFGYVLNNNDTIQRWIFWLLKPLRRLDSFSYNIIHHSVSDAQCGVCAHLKALQHIEHDSSISPIYLSPSIDDSCSRVRK